MALSDILTHLESIQTHLLTYVEELRNDNRSILPTDQLSELKDALTIDLPLVMKGMRETNSALAIPASKRLAETWEKFSAYIQETANADIAKEMEPLSKLLQQLHTKCLSMDKADTGQQKGIRR